MKKLCIRHYQAIHAFRSHGTLTAAAASLGRTTSAISHQIAEIERRLGCKVFARTGRNLVLTTDGELLATSAALILNEAEMVERQLTSKAHQQQTQTVRIGTFAYSCHRWLPAFFMSLRADFPHVAFEIVIGFDKLPVKSFESAEIDIGIVAGEVLEKNIETTFLFDDALVGLCPGSHPLAKRPFLEASDFFHETFVTYSASSEVGFEDDLLWRPAASRPYTMVRVGYADAVIEMVKAGYGLSILSQWAVQLHSAREELNCIQLTRAGLSLRWNALARQDHADVNLLSTVCKRLQTWCEKNPSQIFGDSINFDTGRLAEVQ